MIKTCILVSNSINTRSSTNVASIASTIWLCKQIMWHACVWKEWNKFDATKTKFKTSSTWTTWCCQPIKIWNGTKPKNWGHGGMWCKYAKCGCYKWDGACFTSDASCFKCPWWCFKIGKPPFYLFLDIQEHLSNTQMWVSNMDHVLEDVVHFQLEIWTWMNPLKVIWN